VAHAVGSTRRGHCQKDSGPKRPQATKPAELSGPLSRSRTLPRTTSANAGAKFVFTSKAEVLGVEVDGLLDVVDHVANDDELVRDV
jgi:hypothetical protein